MTSTSARSCSARRSSSSDPHLPARPVRRLLKARPYTVGRYRLLAVALGAAIMLVAGLPTTWPIVIGFAIVCLLLGAVILLGAALDF